MPVPIDILHSGSAQQHIQNAAAMALGSRASQDAKQLANTEGKQLEGRSSEINLDTGRLAKLLERDDPAKK